MIKISDKIDTETRKAQRELQNREIAETLGHIKNKILVMSGKDGNFGPGRKYERFEVPLLR
jgi:hypothetical protein